LGTQQTEAEESRNTKKRKQNIKIAGYDKEET